MTNDDDKLFDEIFGDEEPVPAPAPVPKPPKVAKRPPTVPAQHEPEPPADVGPSIQEIMDREAAQLFSAMVVNDQAPKPAPKAAAPKAPDDDEPDDLAAPVMPQVRRQADPANARSFSESLAPWTLFRGFSVLGMIAYAVGFAGKTLADCWLTLLVVTVALTGAVLIVDYFRAAAAAPSAKDKKPSR